MKSKKTLIIAIALGILCIAAFVAATQFVKNRGGVNVKCNKDFPVSEGLISYRQDDAAWKDSYLGDSEYTMESSGCITTCIATAISETEGAMDPGELVTLLSDEKVYDEEGNMQWNELDDLAGFRADTYGRVDSKYIDTCLSAGRYPIVKVHRRSLFSYHHYVLIVGSMDGEYICMDPLKDSYTKLSDYGNRVYSVRCVWYKNELEDLDEHNLSMIKRLPKNKMDTDRFVKTLKLAIIETTVDGDPCYTTTSVLDFSDQKFYLGCDSSSDYTACAIYTELNESLEKEYKNDIRSAVKHVEELNNSEIDPYENEYKDLEVKIVLVNDEWTVQKFECSVPRYVNGKQSDMLNAFVDKCCIMDYH